MTARPNQDRGDGPESAETIRGTRRWGRRALIAAAISLVASGLIIAATFMPWLGSEGDRTVSGWDLYELQRDAGANVLIIPSFFTDPDGGRVPFLTGLATVISGLWLAGSTIVILALYSLLRRGRALTRIRLSVIALPWLFGVIPIILGVVNAMYYFEAGPASGASLEYGLILLWAATLVGLVGAIVPQSLLSQEYRAQLGTQVPRAGGRSRLALVGVLLIALAGMAFEAIALIVLMGAL